MGKVLRWKYYIIYTIICQFILHKSFKLHIINYAGKNTERFVIRE